MGLLHIHWRYEQDLCWAFWKNWPENVRNKSETRYWLLTQVLHMLDVKLLYASVCLGSKKFKHA